MIKVGKTVEGGRDVYHTGDVVLKAEGNTVVAISGNRYSTKHTQYVDEYKMGMLILVAEVGGNYYLQSWNNTELTQDGFSLYK